jgi:hypothetical protein
MPNYNKVYQIDWNKLATYNCVFIHRKVNPMEDIEKTDELVSWMKVYPDAEDVIEKAKKP